MFIAVNFVVIFNKMICITFILITYYNTFVVAAFANLFLSD